MLQVGGIGILIIGFFFLLWLWNSIYIIKEWERGVVLRLGRLLPEAKGAGLRLVFWPIETLYRISLRLETLDVPPQDIITRDNVSVKVNAVCLFPRRRRQPGAFAGAKLSVRDFATCPDHPAQRCRPIRTR